MMFAAVFAAPPRTRTPFADPQDRDRCFGRNPAALADEILIENRVAEHQDPPLTKAGDKG